MSTELIINASLPEIRIALMEDGKIQDLLIERAATKGIVGNIYKGRVTRVLPGMQAAFVDIGLEKAAFLYVDDVYVHSEIWEAEEGAEKEASPLDQLKSDEGRRHERPEHPEVRATGSGESSAEGAPLSGGGEAVTEAAGGEPSVSRYETSAEEGAADERVEALGESDESYEEEDEDLVHDLSRDGDDDSDEDDLDSDEDDEDDDQDEDEEDDEPARMSEGPENPDGTQAPPSTPAGGSGSEAGGGSADGQQAGGQTQAGEGGGTGEGGEGGETGEGGRRRRRHRRGRRGGRRPARFRDEEGKQGSQPQSRQQGQGGDESYPEAYVQQVGDAGESDSDRSAMLAAGEGGARESARPEQTDGGERQILIKAKPQAEFREQRSRDRRIKPKPGAREGRGQVDIQTLLKEGQEVIVQVAKDPISTKGARLTCHISLPGRHLVCMPTIDHVGVSRRIERDEERRRLRDFVERNRPSKSLGFIVRTAASGRQQSEKRIGQDIEYLTRLWEEIREKASNVTAPALVYEDLNAVLRVIRDWVTEDIDKIVVDSRYHYNEIQRFVSHFMPSLRQKVELYHGDVPIFDAYNISTELARALERKVWLKSGGYIVVDQAEALVAIDVNTGRYVGKKSLEDTILKTNLEAVQEIAYQLRLRNCGGIIILDLIDMEKEENKLQVYRALEEALKRDRARPTILKISELGLVEMTRKRTRDTIVRTLCESCSHCEGKGFIKSKQTIAYEIMRQVEREGVEKDATKVLIQAHSDVIDILAVDERESLDQLERRYRKQIYLQSVADFHPEQFEISGDNVEKKSAAEYFERGRGRDRGRRGRGGDRDQQRSSSQGQGGRGGDRERSGGDRERGNGDRERGRGRDRGRDRDRNRDRGRDRSGGGGIQIITSSATSTPSEGGPVPLEPGQYRAPIETGIQPRPAPGITDDMTEEDRLAYLRAQAAQDAALAGKAPGPNGRGDRRMDRVRSDVGGGPGGGGAGGDRDRGGRGGKRRRRGRRGGKFRREGGFRDGGPQVGPQVGPRPEGGGGLGGDAGGSDSRDSGGGGGDVPPRTPGDLPS